MAHIAGWRSWLSRKDHSLEAVSSNLTPATMKAKGLPFQDNVTLKFKFMEREELLQEVQGVIEADGKQLSRSISSETINAELDDELENIGDDEEANKKVYNRIAKRLLRIDGNIHSNVSREVKDYKDKNPYKEPDEGGKSGKGGKSPKDGEDEESEELKMLKSLSARLDNIEKSRKDKEDADAKNAAIDSVKKGLRAKFKEAKIEVNEYIYKQTIRDLEIPETEEGGSIDTDDLIKKMERAYYRNLKEAGLDKSDTSKPHRGATGNGEQKSRLDMMFEKKGLKEGWKKKD